MPSLMVTRPMTSRDPQKVEIVITKYVSFCVFMTVEDGSIIIDHQQENIVFVIKQQI